MAFGEDLRDRRKQKLRFRLVTDMTGRDSTSLITRGEALTVPASPLEFHPNNSCENLVMGMVPDRLHNDDVDPGMESFQHRSPKKLPPRYDARKHRIEEEDPDLQVKTSSVPWRRLLDAYRDLISKRGDRGLTSRGMKAIADRLDKKFGLCRMKPEDPMVIRFLEKLCFEDADMGIRFGDFLLQEVWSKRTTSWDWVQKHHPDHKVAAAEGSTVKVANLAQWKQGITKLRNTMTQVHGYVEQMMRATPPGEPAQAMQELKTFLARIDTALESAINLEGDPVYNLSASRQERALVAADLAASYIQEAMQEARGMAAFVRKNLSDTPDSRVAATAWVADLQRELNDLYRPFLAAAPSGLSDELTDLKTQLEVVVAQWKLNLKEGVTQSVSFFEADRVDMLLDKSLRAVLKVMRRVQEDQAQTL